MEQLDYFKGEKEILWEIERKEVELRGLINAKEKIEIDIGRLRTQKTQKEDDGLDDLNEFLQENLSNAQRIREEIANLKEGLLQIKPSEDKNKEGLQLNG
jgi:hypothetical protein